MKRILLSLLLCTAVAATACSNPSILINGVKFAKTETGSGKIVTKEIALQPFSTLQASRSVDVTLVASGDKIRIKADDNLIGHVVVEQKNGTLNISIAPDVQIRKAHIEVIVPTDGRINLIKASSSADVTSKVTLTGDAVTLEASSSADIIAAVKARDCQIAASSSADVKAGVSAQTCGIKASSSADVTATMVVGKCEITTSSSADVSLAGEADECYAECSSSSDLSADKFVVGIYDISVSSSADTEIHCTKRLTARASSSGSIDYTGDCEVERHTSSGGSISKK